MNDLAKILGIDEAKVNIKSIDDHAISFYIQTDIKPHSCPNCNAVTSKVHDYRIQKIKDIPLQGKSCFLFLKKRHYLRREKQSYRTITEQHLNECLSTQEI